MSSIRIKTINGQPAAGQTPKFNDELTFDVTVTEKLKGWEYAMVVLVAFQDVNVDGTVDTDIIGPDIVDSNLDTPDSVFLLGGPNSIWGHRGGGPAVARADLDVYGWKGGQESTRVIATTGEFPAAG